MTFDPVFSKALCGLGLWIHSIKKRKKIRLILLTFDYLEEFLECMVQPCLDYRLEIDKIVA